MRLFRRLVRRHTEDLDAATRARERAERELATTNRELDQVRAQTAKYQAIGESLKELREQNHFAMSIRVIFQGGEPREQR